MTLDKSVNLFVPQFCICKIGIVGFPYLMEGMGINILITVRCYVKEDHINTKNVQMDGSCSTDSKEFWLRS